MPSPFQDLPPELRNMIWELVIEPLRPTRRAGSPIFRLNDSRGFPPSITRTCKQFRSETLKMYFANRHFAAYICDPFLGGHDWKNSDYNGLAALICWLNVADRQTHALIVSLEVLFEVHISRWPRSFDAQKDHFCYVRDELKNKGYRPHKRYDPRGVRRLTFEAELYGKSVEDDRTVKYAIPSENAVQDAFKELGLRVFPYAG